MNAPRRWLDEGGGATPGERDLLRSGLAMDPPPDAQARVWAAILAGLPAAGAVGAGGKALAGAKAAVAAKSGGAVAVAGAGVLKSALIGAGLGLLTVATYSVVAPSAPEPRPAAVAPAPDPGPAAPRPQRPRAALPDPEPTAAASAEAPPERPTTEPRADPAAAPERGTMLAEESRLVGEASDALRRGDPAGALVLLDRIRARFPGGAASKPA